MRKNPLLSLIQANSKSQQTKRPLKAELDHDSDANSATVYVYDIIGDFGIESGDFVRTLAKLDVDEIHLRVDSPGGDVFSAKAMQTALAEHKAKIIVHIDGLAVSAASFLVMSGDEIHMTRGALFMIHKGWTIMVGNADDLRKESTVLDKVDEAIADDYANRTGKKRDEMIELMNAETWFSADEALEIGFIDSIVENVKEKSANAHTYDLSAYHNAPRDYTPPVKDRDAHAIRAHLERAAALLQI